MKYSDITIHDRNPVKRWLQRRRFADALGVLRDVRSGNRLRILDYGAGDGELVRQMVGLADMDVLVFEPTPGLMAEARDKLAGLGSVAFADNLDAVESGCFDYVFCLEVFEHLPETETLEAIAEIHRLLRPGGLAVIGVPHELFIPALFKGLFRMSRRYGDFDASPGNVFAAFQGRVPTQRPVAEMSPGFRYHFHHLGFDYRKLEKRFQGRLQLVGKWFSPFPVFGAALNSEVYLLFRNSRPVLPSRGHG